MATGNATAIGHDDNGYNWTVRFDDGSSVDVLKVTVGPHPTWAALTQAVGMVAPVLVRADDGALVVAHEPVPVAEPAVEEIIPAPTPEPVVETVVTPVAESVSAPVAEVTP